MRITKNQTQALAKLYSRMESPGESFLSFRRKAGPMLCGDGALVIRWCDMWIAIEPDGYCHS
jgi:hypothetical protein